MEALRARLLNAITRKGRLIGLVGLIRTLRRAAHTAVTAPATGEGSGSGGSVKMEALVAALARYGTASLSITFDGNLQAIFRRM